MVGEGELKWVLHNMILPHWAVPRGMLAKIGVSKPLKQRQIWAIRFFLDREVERSRFI